MGPEERPFIEARDGFYQATVSKTGWPYVQFRGGTPGDLAVLDDRTIAYVDRRGNRQYIFAGNLIANDRIALILMDDPNAWRLKIWGRVVIDDVHPERDTKKRFGPKAERVIRIHVEAFAWNCPQHIPRRYTREEANDEITRLRLESAALKAEANALRSSI